jgi:site-specific DNA-methyltransferase (cytosine-N4-specific)
MFSVKNDIILDPFLGSGTTTKLAMKLKRNSIGYEMEKKLVPLLKERLISNQKSIKLQIIER